MRFAEVSVMTKAEVAIERAKYVSGSEYLVYIDADDKILYYANAAEIKPATDFVKVPK